MTHIGIDCRFSLGHSGIGRYTREIVPLLISLGSDFSFTLFVRSGKEEWLKDLPGTFSVVEADIPHYSVAEQFRFPLQIRSSGIDLLFAPHFNVPLRCGVPFIVTIHDLILHRYPNQASFLKRRAYRFLMKRSVRKSGKVIAVSAFTAQELVSVYGESIRKKITVIHEGISSQFSPRSEEEQERVRNAYGIRGAFFLYVGNAKEHKNVQLLIDAFRKASPDAQLLLVSSGKEAGRLSLSPGVRILDSVLDADLPALYSAARATVTASLYEGFCFPILEAAACGCPVIATNGSAIAEVAPSGALLLEPTEEAFAKAFSSLPLDCDSAGICSWEETAQKTLSLLREFCP